MKNIIRCCNKDCKHEEPARGVELVNKGVVINGQGYMVLCPICNHQTILVDDK